ncbi:MAG: NERD domain-containing protein [Kiritimatiellae bacterium]|nr:NERD domain-containing protein [Kiritimatiellia bacterium]
MAKVHGVAGEWARVYGVVVGLWPLFLAVAAGGFSIATIVLKNVEAGLLLLAISFVFAIWSWSRGFKQVERFFIGARGEERVSGLLMKLPDSYHIFNDFVVGRKHVDHVVVGPSGVFAVETKCWAGKVTIEDGFVLVNGKLPDRSPLAQVKREAEYVKSALLKEGWKGDVTPVLVFASDTFNAKIAEIQGAVVLNSCEIKSAFSSERIILPEDEKERLVRIIELRG